VHISSLVSGCAVRAYVTTRGQLTAHVRSGWRLFAGRARRDVIAKGEKVCKRGDSNWLAWYAA
jgi:hypothetical protein